MTPSPACNLSKLECDELEFEGGSFLGAGHALPHNAELVVAAAVVVITALVLARRLGRWLPGTRGHGPGPQPVHSPVAAELPPATQQACPPAARQPLPDPLSPRGPPAPHPAAAPRSLSPMPSSASTLRFSLSPGSARKSATRPRSAALLKPPSGLLRHLAALGQRLGLPQRTASVWGLLAGGRAGQGPGPSPGVRYGLGLGEAESADEDSDDETTKQLRQLQQSPEFHLYLKGRGLTNSDVARTASRLRVYRRLRELDPAGFWLLCRAGSTRSFNTQEAPTWALVLEYLLSLASSLTALGLVFRSWASPTLPFLLKTVCLAAAWWLTGAAWVQGRSGGGRPLGMWYEDLRWGHGAPVWRVVVANLAELAYVLGTAGLGAAVSLGMRCRRGAGRRQQGVGEMCGGVRQVREVVVLVQPPDGTERAAAGAQQGR